MEAIDPRLSEFLHDAEAEGATVIQRMSEAPCELCGTVAELRPYGPGGESICFPCGMKDEEATRARFLEMLG